MAHIIIPCSTTEYRGSVNRSYSESESGTNCSAASPSTVSLPLTESSSPHLRPSSLPLMSPRPAPFEYEAAHGYCPRAHQAGEPLGGGPCRPAPPSSGWMLPSAITPSIVRVDIALCEQAVVRLDAALCKQVAAQVEAVFCSPSSWMLPLCPGPTARPPTAVQLLWNTVAYRR